MLCCVVHISMLFCVGCGLLCMEICCVVLVVVCCAEVCCFVFVVFVVLRDMLCCVVC